MPHTSLLPPVGRAEDGERARGHIYMIYLSGVRLRAARSRNGTGGKSGAEAELGWRATGRIPVRGRDGDSGETSSLGEANKRLSHRSVMIIPAQERDAKRIKTRLLLVREHRRARVYAARGRPSSSPFSSLAVVPVLGVLSRASDHRLNLRVIISQLQVSSQQRVKQRVQQRTAILRIVDVHETNIIARSKWQKLRKKN